MLANAVCSVAALVYGYSTYNGKDKEAVLLPLSVTVVANRTVHIMSCIQSVPLFLTWKEIADKSRKMQRTKGEFKHLRRKTYIFVAFLTLFVMPLEITGWALEKKILVTIPQLLLMLVAFAIAIFGVYTSWSLGRLMMRSITATGDNTTKRNTSGALKRIRWSTMIIAHSYCAQIFIQLLFMARIFHLNPAIIFVMQNYFAACWTSIMLLTPRSVAWNKLRKYEELRASSSRLNLESSSAKPSAIEDSAVTMNSSDENASSV